MSSMGICSVCSLEKPLTLHGTCWKCHVGGIQTRSGCGNCSQDKMFAEHRKDQKITVNRTTTELE